MTNLVQFPGLSLIHISASAVVADVVDALKHGSKVHDSLFWQPAEPVVGMLTDPAPAAYLSLIHI